MLTAVTLGEQLAVRKNVVLSIGLITAVAAFAVIHGVAEYLISRSAYSYRIVNGQEQALTEAEKISSRLIGSTLWAIPYGAVCVALLYLPLRHVARGLSDFGGSVPAFLIGGLFGGVLSMVVWLLAGGWGPPLLPSAIVAGAALGVTLYVVEVSMNAHAAGPGFKPFGNHRFTS